MQTLDIITLNLWQTLISLANLLVLFLIIKRFLYKPVINTLNARRASIDKDYSDAAQAKLEAENNKLAYEEKLAGANAQADSIIASASQVAKSRADQILDEANERARSIKSRAEADAELTKQKAQEEIKQQIVEVSSAIAEKMLERELNAKDHGDMIDSFINQMGESDGTDN